MHWLYASLAQLHRANALVIAMMRKLEFAIRRRFRYCYLIMTRTGAFGIWRGFSLFIGGLMDACIPKAIPNVR